MWYYLINLFKKDTGKSYSKTDFSSYKNNAEDKGTDDDSGWNDSSDNHANNSTVNDGFGSGRGGGGGRGGRGLLFLIFFLSKFLLS